jgi:hypothetical protein
MKRPCFTTKFNTTSVVSIFVIACLFSSVALAQTNKVFTARKSYKFNGITCGSSNGRSFTSGRFITLGKKRVFEPLTLTISKLKTQLKKTKKSKQAKIKRDIRKIEQLRTKNWICKLGKIPSINAFASNYSSTGIQQVPVKFDVESNLNNYPINIEIISTSNNGIFQSYPNLSGLVTPNDHRTDSFQIQFRATQNIGSEKLISNPAVLSVSWNQSGSFLGDKYSLARYKNTLSTEEARHLIRTVNLNGNSSELIPLATSQNGLDLVVNKLLTKSQNSGCKELESTAEAAISSQMGRVCRSIEVIDSSGIARYPWFCTANNDASGKVLWNTHVAQQYFTYLSRYSCEPIRERMANFWSNHFAINTNSVSNWAEKSHYIKKHIDLVRSTNNPNQSLLSPFNFLVSKMHGEDGLMLMTLNNNRNDYSSFGNENYARELLELFTLGTKDAVNGATNYTESDVYAVSFAVMGWTEKRDFVRNLTFTCDPTFDSSGNPTNECARIPANLRTQNSEFYNDNPTFNNSRWNHPTRPTKQLFFANTPLETYEAFKSNTLNNEDTITPYLMRHNGVARYIATRLLSTFISSDITNDMVEELANDIRNNNYAIEPALIKIFSSSAFYSKLNKAGILSPYEHVISILRGFDLPVVRTSSRNLISIANDAIYRAGQRLFEHPTIFGHKEVGKITGAKIHTGVFWLNLQFWLERSKGIINYLNNLHSTRAEIQFSWNNLISSSALNSRNPNLIVDELLSKSNIILSDSKKQKLVEYFLKVSLRSKKENFIDVPDAQFIRVVSLNTLTQTQFNSLLELKIPGLISIIAQLKEANVK